MDPSQYFILLIRYTAGYRDLDRLTGAPPHEGNSGVEIRAGLSGRYKISIDQAVAAFAQLEDKSRSSKLMKAQKSDDQGSGLGRLFIGRPLDELLNDRLIPLLRFRLGMGFPWNGAELFFNDHQGRALTADAGVDAKYWAEDNSYILQGLPNLVTQDQLQSILKQYSFPLLAMQFALRHLVRCTEFCLVCHCKVEADFEALKPYVCSKPLCLYQYMSLGFGPSIEHEIITQPHVVDLLISFCYTSACNRKLRYLPTGMALMVPSPALMPGSETPLPYPSPSYSYPHLVDGVNTGQISSKAKKDLSAKTYKARLDLSKNELIFDPGSARVLHPGNWIGFPVSQGAKEDYYHCRVLDVIHPTARLGEPIVQTKKTGGKTTQATAMSASQRHLSGANIANAPTTLTPATTPPPTTHLIENQIDKYQPVEIVVYDQNFDDLDANDKQKSIVLLLDSLPSVPQMSVYLRSKGGQDISLRNWADRISPAALGLLRWIIASNRSCIVQVDSLDESTRKSEDRVAGMSGWMQFRFAQGAPDKEQRFISSIKQTTPGAQYPTLFAWHGSPLHNWHGIVREGLHFEKADHGRAFGDGCYHSLHCGTSMGYSGMYGRGGVSISGTRFGEWPHSQLKISQAIALNEIVNAPSQFVSKSPHLVVAQLDWIQSRYLFVKCEIQNGLQIPDIEPSQIYEQDPAYRPVGEKSTQLIIPLTAVSKSRRPISKTVKAGNKKVKVDNVQDAEEAAMLSEDTDLEDVSIYFSDEEEPEIIPVKSSKGKERALVEPLRSKDPDKSKTDFVPGKLDHSTLPLLEPPSYATSMATRALQREIQATLKVQESHPLHELGWYIDPELVSNVYQWIVELHSFESNLPLAKDMKSKDIKSVVMEIRFGKNYPMSPPFVRVIRPRFLSFMQGGGGHVTAGGALCMELLTNNGWSAVSNIESVLLQVRLAMSSTDPHPARLEQGPVRDYQVGEAIEAFKRACMAHGVSVTGPSESLKLLLIRSSGKFPPISLR